MAFTQGGQIMLAVLKLNPSDVSKPLLDTDQIQQPNAIKLAEKL